LRRKVCEPCLQDTPLLAAGFFISLALSAYPIPKAFGTAQFIENYNGRINNRKYNKCKIFEKLFGFVRKILSNSLKAHTLYVADGEKTLQHDFTDFMAPSGNEKRRTLIDMSTG
jgi:hypothetical protein